MKTGKFTIAIRSSCVFFPGRNMKPSLGVSLRSEKFGGEFKNSRYYVCSFALTKSTILMHSSYQQTYPCVAMEHSACYVVTWTFCGSESYSPIMSCILICLRIKLHTLPSVYRLDVCCPNSMVMGGQKFINDHVMHLNLL